MSKLSDFAIGADPQPKIDWVDDPDRLKITVRRKANVLVVDQALANSGYAQVLMDPDGNKFSVTWTGTLTTEAISKGHEDTLLRGDSMYRQYRQTIGMIQPDVILHETPPVGGRMARPESSLVAASALRNAASSAMAHSVPVVMIGAQKAKKRITGNGNAKKPEVHAQLRLMLPTLAHKKPMNQHILDAVALAVVYAEEAP